MPVGIRGWKAKLLLMLICWFVPVGSLSIERRQSFLELLDALGKWSLVDSYVMVIFMVAFDLQLSVHDLAPKAITDAFDEIDAKAALRVYVEPLFSFYCFMVATVLSLVLSHVMTAYHRYAHLEGEFGLAMMEPDSIGTSSQLEQHPHGVGRERLCKREAPKQWFQAKVFVYAPTLLMVGSLLLVVIGIWLETFQFRFQGLTAFILGPEASVRPYSVLELSNAIPASSPWPNSFGIRSIQLSFLLFVALVVVTYHLVLIVLWCAPLTKGMQCQLLVGAQILNAWSALDVFVVAILASVLEIQEFVAFIIGDKCDGINSVVGMMPFKDEVPGDHITCFDVVSELSYGFWILFASAMISSVVGTYMLGICSTALFIPDDDRDSSLLATPHRILH